MTLNNSKNNKRSIFVLSIILLTLFTIFFAPFSAVLQVKHASAEQQGSGRDGDPNNTPLPANPPTTGGDGQAPAPTNPAGNGTGGGNTPTPAPAAGNQAGGGIANAECGLITNTSVCISNIVYVFTAGLMSIVAYIGGYILDIGISLTLNSVTYSQSFITEAWTVVRDIADMAFIFMLVYLAVIIILKAETGSTMRALGAVIIVALLINFSFFASRLVIDAGNILAIQFYNSIQAPTLAATSGMGTTTATTATTLANLLPRSAQAKDLTYGIMNLIGVQTILGSNSFGTAFQSNSATGLGTFLQNLLILSFVYIVVGVIFAILAFVFLVVGFKFIIRSVVLWIAIIASPIAFVFGAFGSVASNSTAKKYFSMWWSNLLQFSFYPAVFLFFFVIVLKFASGLSGSNSSILGNVFQGAADTTNGGSVFIRLGAAIAGISIRLGLVVILLWIAMKASDKVAITGIKVVDGAVSKVQQKLGGMTRWAARRPQVAASRAGGLLYSNTAFSVAAGAKKVSNTLNNSEWLNTKGTLRAPVRAVVRGLQNNVLTPVVNTKAFGAPSYTDRDKHKKEIEKDRIQNLTKIDSKELVSTLIEDNKTFDKTTETLFKGLQKRAELVEALERARRYETLDTNNKAIVEASIAALTPAQVAEKAKLEKERDVLSSRLTRRATEISRLQNEQGKVGGALNSVEKTNLDDLNEKKAKIRKNADKMNSFSKTEIEAALSKTATVDSVMPFIKEGLLAKIQAVEKYSDADRHTLKASYEEKSNHAPKQLMQEQVISLRETLEDFQRNVGTSFLPTFMSALKKDSTINGAVIKDMQDDMRTTLAAIENLPQEQKIIAKELLRNAKTTVTKTGAEVAKVEKGEYKVKE